MQEFDSQFVQNHIKPILVDMLKDHAEKKFDWLNTVFGEGTIPNEKKTLLIAHYFKQTNGEQKKYAFCNPADELNRELLLKHFFFYIFTHNKLTSASARNAYFPESNGLNKPSTFSGEAFQNLANFATNTALIIQEDQKKRPKTPTTQTTTNAKSTAPAPSPSPAPASAPTPEQQQQANAAREKLIALGFEVDETSFKFEKNQGADQCVMDVKRNGESMKVAVGLNVPPGQELQFTFKKPGEVDFTITASRLPEDFKQLTDQVQSSQPVETTQPTPSTQPQAATPTPASAPASTQAPAAPPTSSAPTPANPQAAAPPTPAAASPLQSAGAAATQAAANAGGVATTQSAAAAPSAPIAQPAQPSQIPQPTPSQATGSPISNIGSIANQMLRRTIKPGVRLNKINVLKQRLAQLQNHPTSGPAPAPSPGALAGNESALDQNAQNTGPTTTSGENKKKQPIPGIFGVLAVNGAAIGGVFAAAGTVKSEDTALALNVIKDFWITIGHYIGHTLPHVIG